MSLSKVHTVIASALLAIVSFSCENEPFNQGSNPGPFISSFAPMSGTVGQVITLSGEYLKHKDLVVKFNGIQAEIEYRYSDQEILVTVPPGATTGEISVEHSNKFRLSDYPFMVTDVAPVTAHTILIHENQRIATFILTQREFDSLEYPDKIYYNDLYKMFKDDFDFILELHNREVTGSNTGGSAIVYSNDISGIGSPIYSGASTMGSAGKLKTILTVRNSYSLEVDNWNMILHEILHTWANYGIPTEILDDDNKSYPDVNHWGISGAGQILRGFDQSTLKTNVDGNPNKYSFTPPVNPFLTRYSNFELYLMGLISLEEVTPFDVFADLVSQDGNTFIANKRITYDQQLILEKLGPRIPSFADSQKKFKILVLVFSPTPLSDDKIQMLDNRAESLFRPSADEYEERINFWEATYGKASIEVGVLQGSVKD